MSFQFYATFDSSNLTSYIPDVPVLLPATSWYRKGMKKPSLPEYITHKAADSGGYVASRIWGEYKFTTSQYVDWLGLWLPNWCAFQDYCCEEKLCVVTKNRQDKTTMKALTTWNEYKNVPWQWIPTIQGLEPDDYKQHAIEMKPLIDEMKIYYNSDNWRIGIGTLCARVNSQMIQKIVNTVQEVLPDCKFHLWGIKLESLRTLNMLNIISTDSAAWHGMYGNRDALHEKAHLMGMNRQRYIIQVALPEYIKKVENTVERSYILTKEIDTTWIKKLFSEHGFTLRIKEKNNRKYVYAVKRLGAITKDFYIGILHTLTIDIVLKKLATLPAGTIPNKN